MNGFTHKGRVVALLALVALVVAACSGDSSNEEPAPLAPAAGAEQPDPLPPNDDPGDAPAIAGTCLEGEPDCLDTLEPGQEPQDLPDHDLPVPPRDEEPGAVSGGMLVAGGLTVSEALATDATTILAVQGFLFDDGSGPRLCELLAESLPPLCGGASIPITGHEEVIAVPLVTAQGVTWTDASVTVFGEIIDGILVVDPTVAG